MSNEINIELMPKQILLSEIIEYNDQYTDIIYGGARGGGKSYAARALAVYFGLKYGITSLIFRRYSADLIKNHWNDFLQEYPIFENYCNKTDMIIYHPYKKNTPIIKFDYAETMDEIVKVGQGTKYVLVFIDEATQITEDMMAYLKTCNRDANNLFPSRPKMIYTANPGGAGHSYIKRVAIDKIYYEGENPANYFYIQAHLWDNYFWSQKELNKEGISMKTYLYEWTDEQRKNFAIERSDYAQNLKGRNKELTLANLYGDWNIFGGMFFKDLDLTTELIDPFEIPSHWDLIATLDPAVSSTCSSGILARDPEGTIYRVATYYEKNRSIYEHIDALYDFICNPNKSVASALLGGRLPRFIVAGRDAFQKKERFTSNPNELTWEELCRRKGLPRLVMAHTNRIQGWWAWKSLMPDKFKIFKYMNAPLIEEMQGVESDKLIVEDILGRGHDLAVVDHALDECRYGIVNLQMPYNGVVDYNNEPVKTGRMEVGNSTFDYASF